MFKYVDFFTVRRYASAVYAVVVCLSVSVCLYWQLSIYFCIVPNSGTSGLNTSLLLLSKTFLKVSTIKTSLVLLKTHIFIVNC